MKTRTLAIVIAIALMMLSAFSDAVGAQATPQTVDQEFVVETVDLAKNQLAVHAEASGESRTFDISAPNLQANIHDLAEGDHVHIVSDPLNGLVARQLDVAGQQVSVRARLIAMALAFGLLLFAAALFSHWKPAQFLVGIDNRYSNSQCQLGIWFVAALTIYLATFGLRLWIGGLDFLGGIAIPQNVLVLTGLSALTFGGARLITTQKVAGTSPNDIGAPKQPAMKPHLIADLMQNDDGKPDIGDFQMIFLSALAVIIYVWSGFHFMSHIELRTTVTLPDVDTTLLSTYGIGQGAYLVKKVASDPGAG